MVVFHVVEMVTAVLASLSPLLGASPLKLLQMRVTAARVFCHGARRDGRKALRHIGVHLAQRSAAGFAHGDLASLLTAAGHRTGMHTATEERSLTQGTAGWAGLGTSNTEGAAR